MRSAPEFLTEKEEKALARMELWQEWRHARGRKFTGHESVWFVVPKLIFPAYCIYEFCSKPLSKYSISLVCLATLILGLMGVYLMFGIMDRRLQALGKLFEEEIRRKP